MKHIEIKEYLRTLKDTGRGETIVTFEKGEMKYELNEVFSFRNEDDYYELYAQENQELKGLTATQMLKDIEEMEESNKEEDEMTPNVRVDVVVGDEDSNDIVAEELSKENLVAYNNGVKVKTIQEIKETASSMFTELEALRIEEKYPMTLETLVEEVASDMKADYEDNGGEDMTPIELEEAGMYQYTTEELNLVSIYLKDENRYKKTLVNGVSYHYDTSEKVIRVLENARNNRSRIRIDLGHTEDGYSQGEEVSAGQSWGEEWDVEGSVGRSTGVIKIPLLIPKSNSMGGGGILDHCIVCIRSSTGDLLYRHEDYQPVVDWVNAEIIVNKEAESNPFELVGKQNKNGEEIVWARFDKLSQADRYLKKKRKFEVAKKVVTKKEKSNSTETKSSNNMK